MLHVASAPTYADAQADAEAGLQRPKRHGQAAGKVGTRGGGNVAKGKQNPVQVAHTARMMEVDDAGGTINNIMFGETVELQIREEGVEEESKGGDGSSLEVALGTKKKVARSITKMRVGALKDHFRR